jgi:hypothetical protein
MPRAVLAGLALLGVGLVHPMHTSLTELVYDEPAGTVAVAVRVFADDWAAAGGRTDSLALPALAERLQLIDRAGQRLPLRWTGATRAADTWVLRLTAAAPAGPAGWRVSQSLLTDRFPDQVNIVRVTYAGRTASLLFTRGDGPKPLP